MKVLIVSVTTGGGHNASADSISAEFERLKLQGADIIVAREDFYEYIGDIVYKFVDRGYLFLTQFFPELFGKSYDSFEHNEQMRKAAAALSGGDFIADRFAGYFRGDMPDVIITTHVFSAYALSELKAKGRFDMPIIGVNTDYCIHPYWEDCKYVDYIVTPDKLFTESAMRRGVNPDKVLPFGLPVHEKFLKSSDQTEARRELGLDPDKKTILVMGGSMGYGNIELVVSEILSLKEYQVAAICGNNKQLLKKLENMPDGDLRVYGYVSNVEFFMDAADCIITKPGGLTSTEFLVKNLPAILINPIPGPEQRNMQFLCNSGCAIHAGKNFSISEALNLLFHDEDILIKMKAASKKYAKPDSAKHICEFAINLINDKSLAAVI